MRSLFRRWTPRLLVAGLLLCSIDRQSPAASPSNQNTLHLGYGKTLAGTVTTISTLTWNTTRSRLEITDDGDPRVLLYGNFGKHDRASLICAGKRVAIESGGNFRIAFHPHKIRETLKLIAIGTHGDIEQEVLIVDMPELPALLKAAPRAAPMLTLGAGFTYLTYSETTVPTFSETAITAKASFTHKFKDGSPWDIGLSGYATVVPLTTTSVYKETIDFLGFNARVGYQMPFVAEPWRLAVMLGLYFTTTSSSDGTFGFTNLMGPELYPVLRRKLPGGGMISGYLKYSPVGSGLSLTFGSREIAGGVAYSPKATARFPISFTLDIANLSANIEDTQFNSTSATLGIAIGF